MITNKCFWSVSIVLSLASLAGGLLAGDAPQGPPPSRALWAFETESPRALVEHADVVALVEVVGTMPGRIAVSEGGEDALPFELTEVRVIDGIKGAAAGERLLVERAGGVDPITGDRVSIDLDGGAFEIGARYVLLLKRQPDGEVLFQINDQARFRVEDGKTISPAGGSIAERFDGRPLEESLTALRSIR